MGRKEGDTVGFDALRGISTNDLTVKEEFIDVTGGGRVGVFVLVMQGQ